MIVDSNAYLGHWPFRRLRYNTGAGLLKLMDRAGIDKACVSLASAILYKNCHSGNEELLDEIELYRERLIPFAVLNPAYAAWRRDLQWCKDVLGAKGLRLYPGYHRYKLGDACCHDLVEAASDLDMLISIPVRVVDPRQRHWLIDVPDIQLEEISGLVAAHPEARFVILEGAGFMKSDLLTKADELPSNYWIEMSRIEPLYAKELQRILCRLGAERIIFGSGICFKYPEPALLRIEVLQANKEEKSKIYGGNMLALLEGRKSV